jgi:hypothetical protein
MQCRREYSRRHHRLQVVGVTPSGVLSEMAGSRQLTFMRHNWPMAKTLTAILLSLVVGSSVVGSSACNRGLSSVESRRETTPAESETRPAPCGKVLRFDDAGIKRLDLDTRLAQLVTDAGFTDEELKEMKSSSALLKEQAFEGYRSAFSTWYKPTDDIQATLDSVVTGTTQSEKYKKLPPRKRALNDGYLTKFEKVMVKAHSLGKTEGTTAPCPF